MFPSSSSLPSRPTQSVHFTYCLPWPIFEESLVLHLDNLSIYCILPYAVVVYACILAFCKLSAPRNWEACVPYFGSMIPTFLYLPKFWCPLRMFELLTFAFASKWEVEIYKYFTLFFSTYSPNPKYVLYNVNHSLTIEFSSIFCALYIYDVVKLITGIGICWPNMMCF